MLPASDSNWWMEPLEWWWRRDIYQINVLLRNQPPPPSLGTIADLLSTCVLREALAKHVHVLNVGLK